MGWRRAFKRSILGFEVFSFSIIRLPFVIVRNRRRQAMEKDKRIMENERLGNSLGENEWPQTF
jgi:hypothetical protein